MLSGVEGQLRLVDLHVAVQGEAVRRLGGRVPPPPEPGADAGGEQERNQDQGRFVLNFVPQGVGASNSRLRQLGLRLNAGTCRR